MGEEERTELRSLLDQLKSTWGSGAVCGDARMGGLKDSEETIRRSDVAQILAEIAGLGQTGIFSKIWDLLDILADRVTSPADLQLVGLWLSKEKQFLGGLDHLGAPRYRPGHDFESAVTALEELIRDLGITPAVEYLRATPSESDVLHYVLMDSIPALKAVGIYQARIQDTTLLMEIAVGTAEIARLFDDSRPRPTWERWTQGYPGVQAFVQESQDLIERYGIQVFVEMSKSLGFCARYALTSGLGLIRSRLRTLEELRAWAESFRRAAEMSDLHAPTVMQYAFSGLCGRLSEERGPEQLLEATLLIEGLSAARRNLQEPYEADGVAPVDGDPWYYVPVRQWWDPDRQERARIDEAIKALRETVP